MDLKTHVAYDRVLGLLKEMATASEEVIVLGQDRLGFRGASVDIFNDAGEFDYVREATFSDGATVTFNDAWCDDRRPSDPSDALTAEEHETITRLMMLAE